MIQKISPKTLRWLIFFYSLPAKPVGNRVKIWRKLSRIGAVPFKGSGYILPDNEEHYEYFQWLVSEVIGRGGEGAFILVDRIESMEEKEMITLFDHYRQKDYQPVEEGLETLERGIHNLKKGEGIASRKKWGEDYGRLFREFEAIRKVDFFLSKKGADLEMRLKAVDKAIKDLATPEIKKPENVITGKDLKAYQRRIWVTRTRPYIDRLASAWLIRKFIDKRAEFQFIEGEGLSHPREGQVSFDLKSGDFTHQGDFCTFETLIEAFGLKEKALKNIAEIVHQIDLKDDKFSAPEAKGVEELIKGIRKTAQDDREILEKGLALFEMLYASKTR